MCRQKSKQEKSIRKVAIRAERLKAQMKGKKEGITEGIIRGLELGREDGAREAKIEMAKAMKMKKYSIAEIVELTGLKKKDVEGLG